MRLHRFYIGNESPSAISNPDLVHQWRNVFRMHEGDPAILFGDDGIESTCTLVSIDKKSASWHIASSKQGKRSASELVLCAALVKKDNFDLIIRQATEIGVTKIIPVISERSEKKGLNMERARRILVEASEQCGRVDVPNIDEPTSLDDVLASKNGDVIAFDPKGQPLNSQLVHNASNTPNVFIGPEGGWTERELQLFMSHGKLYSLPTFVLRAETAASVALAIVQSNKK